MRDTIPNFVNLHTLSITCFLGARELLSAIDFCPQLGITNLGTQLNHHHHAPPMARGKPIPEAMRWVVIRLSTTMTVEEIATYTDLGQRSIARILDNFKKTGEVKAAEQVNARAPPRANLCEYDIQVCSYCTSHFCCTV
jgi:hypothetical protein